MPQTNKAFLRISRSLREAVSERTSNPSVIELPGRQWNDCLSMARSIELAEERGWQAAAHRRKQELANELDMLQRSFQRLTDRLNEELRQQPFASESELYRDLIALTEEFVSIEFREDDTLLCVTTLPVELIGIALGRFEIRLYAQSSAGLTSYRIVALDPNPAYSNADVVHPHVNDETLCEGDGRRAIASALAEGRLFDFFTIVNRLLNTYAEGRAYVELDRWYGVACGDCGCTVDHDEQNTCSRCEQTICSDCTSCCQRCGDALCWNCTTCCAQCDEACCSACLERCRACDHALCRGCLNNGLCQDCENHEQDSAEETLETCETTPPHPEIQPDSLGQTAIPAGLR